ncbi:MAG: ribosome biogenesis GTP-binding protein YihA/YsxC [Burkholderiales bacterium]
MKKRIDEPREKSGREKRKARTHDFTAGAERVASRGERHAKLPLAKATYIASAHFPSDLPRPGPPELAFAGRSNAGKSSAINTLAGRKRLAFVSKTPGRTQLINFFSLGDGGILVDLPGYGFADAPGEVRRHWEELVGTYIATRESLAAVVVVMDSRHPLMPLDRQLLQWLRVAGRPTHVLLTKSDKLSKQAAQRTLSEVRKALRELTPGTTVQLFSSLKQEGIPEAASTLTRLAAGKNKAPPKGE